MHWVIHLNQPMGELDDFNKSNTIIVKENNNKNLLTFFVLLFDN